MYNQLKMEFVLFSSYTLYMYIANEYCYSILYDNRAKIKMTQNAMERKTIKKKAQKQSEQKRLKII